MKKYAAAYMRVGRGGQITDNFFLTSHQELNKEEINKKDIIKNQIPQKNKKNKIK